MPRPNDRGWAIIGDRIRALRLISSPIWVVILMAGSQTKADNQPEQGACIISSSSTATASAGNENAAGGSASAAMAAPSPPGAAGGDGGKSRRQRQQPAAATQPPPADAVHSSPYFLFEPSQVRHGPYARGLLSAAHTGWCGGGARCHPDSLPPGHTAAAPFLGMKRLPGSACSRCRHLLGKLPNVMTACAPPPAVLLRPGAAAGV